jgi:hypothetical protein
MKPLEAAPPDQLPRVVSLTTGAAMVVTDLHGDWDSYCHCRDRFLELEQAGHAEYLIFTGDLVHSDGPPETDRSLDIVLDILELRETLGARLICLLGNHELPHLYGITLSKGKHTYTPRFEAALGAHRQPVMALFDGMPIYVRTRAGISVCHAGAAAELCAPGAARRVFGYSHQRVRDATNRLLPQDQRLALRERFGRLNGTSYDQMARAYLSTFGPDDPRYDDLLVGFLVQSHPDFDLLWHSLFNRNERQYGETDYAVFLDALLQELSTGYHHQELLVTGHIPCRGGYQVVADRQLRLASAVNCALLTYARQSRELACDGIPDLGARPVCRMISEPERCNVVHPSAGSGCTNRVCAVAFSLLRCYNHNLRIAPGRKRGETALRCFPQAHSALRNIADAKGEM